MAMVEFRYDRRDDEYTFIGVSPRFPTSTALALDAGVNLPYLVACLFTGQPLSEVRPYSVGVRERWLRGDLMALKDAIAKPKPRAPALVPYARTSSFSLWGTFLKDLLFRARSSEFRLSDPGPGVLEFGALFRLAGAWIWEGLMRALTAKTPPLKLESEPPLAFQAREEGVVPAGFQIGEEVGVGSLQQEPGPGSGEFALSGRER